MTMIRAHWNQGRVVLDQPASWTEGARLIISEADEAASKVGPEDLLFMTEQEQGDDPESIAMWIADCDAIPPLEMTPEEEAEMWAWHQQVGDYTLAAVRQQWLRGEP